MIHYKWKDWLFPTRCVLCGNLHPDGLCENCKDSFSFPPPPKREMEHCVSLFPYRDAVREAILRFKFRGKIASGEIFGTWLADYAKQCYPIPFDFVTWIPVSSARYKERGYDQTKIVARVLSRSGMGKLMPLLHKTVHNTAQSSLHTLEERKENVCQVYQPIHKKQIIHAKILLVDDIITTGSTMGEAQRVLYEAGASQVCGITLADAG